MNGAEVFTQILKREGTKVLSCYPRNPLIEPCAATGIRPILCRQERVGVGIADGISRTTGGGTIGVFASQHGPGIENAFPGVAQAFSENVPLLVVPGGPIPSRLSTRPVFDAVKNYAHVTKWATRIYDAQDIPAVLNRAYHLMRSGKSGPVLVEASDAVFNQPFRGRLDYTPAPGVKSAPDPDDVAAAAKIVVKARRPVIFAGAGVLWAGATKELVRLAELLDAPVLSTNPGKSAFPETHPLSLGAGCPAKPKPLVDFLDAADVVLAIGSSLTVSPFNPNIPAGKTVVQLTNHEDDLNKEYLIAQGLLGDAKLGIEMLIKAVRKELKGKKRPPRRAKQALAAKRAFLKDWQKLLTSDEVPLNPYRVADELMKLVDRDNTIVTHDSGSPRDQLLPFWETTKPHTYMGWGKSTQLGHGLGLTLGAKLADPRKLCVNFMGDSAIGMTGMDLETASRNGIATMTVVLNNGVMAAERNVLKISTKKYGALTVGGNYSVVGEGLGLTTFRVEAPDDIAPTFKKAIAATKRGETVLVEFLTKINEDFARY